MARLLVAAQPCFFWKDIWVGMLREAEGEVGVEPVGEFGDVGGVVFPAMVGAGADN